MNGETQEHKGLQPTPIHVTARFEDRGVGIQLPHWGLELTLNDAKELHRHLEACLRGCDEALDGKIGTVSVDTLAWGAVKATTTASISSSLGRSSLGPTSTGMKPNSSWRS